VLDAQWLDFDGDGHEDLFLSHTDRDELYHNAGGGRFRRGRGQGAGGHDLQGCACTRPAAQA
jgi:hypothetical protein